MLNIETLKAYGANTEEGMTRCMNNEGFYLKMIDMFLKNPGLDKLAEAIAANDMDAGFEAAHGIKGVVNNLSLTPIAKPVGEMTELLRAKTEMDYSELLAEAEKQLAALQALSAE